MRSRRIIASAPGMDWVAAHVATTRAMLGDRARLGAHDDGARTKTLAISGAQDASVVTLAADAGVPGRAEAVPFPVVVATYTGDWWQAARLYRQWASRQAWTRKLGAQAWHVVAVRSRRAPVRTEPVRLADL